MSLGCQQFDVLTSCQSMICCSCLPSGESVCAQPLKHCISGASAESAQPASSAGATWECWQVNVLMIIFGSALSCIPSLGMEQDICRPAILFGHSRQSVETNEEFDCCWCFILLDCHLQDGWKWCTLRCGGAFKVLAKRMPKYYRLL